MPTPEEAADGTEILVVEDRPEDFELLIHAIRQSGPEPIRCERVETLPELERALTARRWDVILADYHLPALNFDTTLAACRLRVPDVPLILVSGSIGEENAVELLRHGVADFVLKGNLVRLAPAIARAKREAAERRARKAAERALRLSEERLNLAIGATDDGIWDWDLSNGNLFLSAQCYQLIGHPAASFSTDPDALRSLVHPADWLAAESAVREHRLGRSARLHSELRVVDRNGHQRWLLFRGRATDRDVRGNALRIIGTATDISSRKSAETELERHRHALKELVTERTAELAAAEAHARLLLESSADGLCGIDDEGAVSFVNPAACRILGFDAVELVGRSFEDLLCPRQTDGSPVLESSCVIRASLREGTSVTIDAGCFRCRDGRTVNVSYASRPMLRNGRIVGAVVSFRDIEERLAAEQAREEARRAAERLARIKSEFLAHMSHEIRNPLHGVLGLAQAGFRDSVGRSRAQEIFGRILDAGRLLQAIIDDILDFSKIEAGKMRIDATPIDVHRALRDVVAMCEQRAQTKGLAVVLDADASLPPSVLSDPVRLAQILLNLLSNAVKFTECGHIRLSAAREGDQLLLRVSDTGIGMEPSQLERLFLPFEQAKSVSGQRHEGAGTGLGLTITRGLVSLMEGELHVESTPNVGTTISVRLPLHAVDATTPTSDRAPGQEPAFGPRLLGLSILAVEDSEINQWVLQDLLTAEGARVVVASDGRAAVECVGPGNPCAFDVVLMDIEMPVMDGYEATRQIVAIAPGLPIIGQTAHAMAEEREQCLAAGMLDHVAKPIDIDRLVGVILKHARTRTEREATAPSEATNQAIDKASVTAGLIDWAALDQRYRGRRDFQKRLLALFAESHCCLADRLHESLGAGNVGDLAALAHKLKAAAGEIRADRLAALAAQTEVSARERGPDVFELGMALVDLLRATLDEIDARGHAPAVGGLSRR